MARLGRLRRMVEQAEGLAGQRRCLRSPIADLDDGCEGPLTRRFCDLARVLLRILEPQRDGIVSPGIVEDVAAVGAEDDFEAQLLGSIHEGLRLVAGGGAEKENARFGR